MRTAAKTAFIMAILTLGSKVLGFLREIIFANYFGVSYIGDVYSVANSIPNMIFAGIFGAIATSFIPIFSKKVEKEGQIAGNVFTNQTINLLFIVSVISSIIGIVLSDQVVSILAVGFTGEAAKLASFYVKITFSYTLFTSIAGVFESYLKYKGVFISPIIAGYSISISSIIFIFVSASFGANYLIFGMLVGNIIRTIIISYIAKRKGYRHKLDFRVSKTVKEIFVLAIPVFVGSTVDQINLAVNKNIATLLPEGSAISLDYSNLIIALITGVTSTVIATILYPKMAQAHSTGNEIRFNELFSSGLSILYMLGIPFSLGTMLYSNDIIQIIYERGAFDQNAISLTNGPLFFYALGMCFLMIQNFSIQAFFSKHDTKTPLKVSVMGVIINIVTNLVLVRSLANSGLALGNTIAIISSMLVLQILIKKKKYIEYQPGFKMKIFKIFMSAIVSIGISYLFYIFVNNNIWMPKMVIMAFVVIIAVITYLLLLKAFKIEELIHIRDIFKISDGRIK